MESSKEEKEYGSSANLAVLRLIRNNIRYGHVVNDKATPAIANSVHILYGTNINIISKQR